VVLRDIPDSIESFLPADCALEQLVIQSEPDVPGDARYLINDDIWRRLPVEDQVAVILHEIIYREAFPLGHQDSRKVRYFNSWLYSNDIRSAGEATRLAVFRQMTFPTMHFDRMDIDLFERHADGTFQWIGPDDVSKPFKVFLSAPTEYAFGKIRVKLEEGSQSFHELSKPEELRILEGTWELNGAVVKLAPFHFKGSELLKLDASGRVLLAPLGKNLLVLENFRGEIIEGTFLFDPASAAGKLTAMHSANIGAAEILHQGAWHKVDADQEATTTWFSSGGLESLNLSARHLQSWTDSRCDWKCNQLEFHENGPLRSCKAEGGNASYQCGTRELVAKVIEQDILGHLTSAESADLLHEGPGFPRQHVRAEKVDFHPSGAPMKVRGDLSLKIVVPLQATTLPLTLSVYQADFTSNGALERVDLGRHGATVPIRIPGFGDLKYVCEDRIKFDSNGMLSELENCAWSTGWSSKISIYPAGHPVAIVIQAFKPSYGPKRVFQDKSNYNFSCYCDEAYLLKNGTTVCDKAWGMDDNNNSSIDGCAAYPDGRFALRPKSWHYFEMADGSRNKVTRGGEWAYFDSQGFFVEAKPVGPMRSRRPPK